MVKKKGESKSADAPFFAESIASKKVTADKEEDIVIEEDSFINSEQEKLKKFREKLKKCETEKREYLNGWQRSKADFVNARKEEEEARKSFSNFIKEDILLEFVALTDNFEMAFSDKKVWESVDKGWRQGVEHIYTQFISVLEKQGVEPIEAVGKKFNPEEHHSIGNIEVKEKEKDNLILEELQRGYKFNGKIIRPSQVKVGIYKI